MTANAYSLAELAEASGQSPRTIRFYIARGILAGPVQAGRNARYDESHRERLAEIGALKAQGLTLAEIALQLGEGPAVELPPPTPLGGLMLSEDVQALVRSDLPPWRMKQVRKILAEASRQLRALETPEDKEKEQD